MWQIVACMIVALRLNECDQHWSWTWVLFYCSVNFKIAEWEKRGIEGSLLSTQGKILALVFQNTPGSSIRPSILAHCQEANVTNQNILFFRGRNKSLWTMSSTALLMSSWWQTGSITFLFTLPQSASVMKSHLWWYGLPVCHKFTNKKDHLSVCWGKGQCVGMGKTCEGDFLSPEWPITLTAGFGSSTACFSINAAVQRRTDEDHEVWLGLGGCGWKRSKRREGDKQFTSGCDSGGGGDVWHPASRAVENSGPD